jgi:hypothetical protein
MPVSTAESFGDRPEGRDVVYRRLRSRSPERSRAGLELLDVDLGLNQPHDPVVEAGDGPLGEAILDELLYQLVADVRVADEQLTGGEQRLELLLPPVERIELLYVLAAPPVLEALDQLLPEPPVPPSPGEIFDLAANLVSVLVALLRRSPVLEAPLEGLSGCGPGLVVHCAGLPLRDAR